MYRIAQTCTKRINYLLSCNDCFFKWNVKKCQVFVVSDGKIVDISGLIREYLGYSRPRAQGLDYAVRLGGYGTDVGYDAIIHLASALYAESYALVPKRL